jgi:hypothetical protein
VKVVQIKDTPGVPYHSKLEIQTVPLHGGYVDFMRSSDRKLTPWKGPPRSSMLEDMLYYLVEHGGRLPSLDDPACVAVFAQKIVASHYLSLTSFMTSILSSGQWHLSRQDNMSKFNIATAEQQWSDIQSWERRLNEYFNDLQETMVRLGFRLQGPDCSSCNQSSTWYELQTDFQFLWMQLQNLIKRVSQYSESVSVLASIAANRQALLEQKLSLRETRRTKALTLVGLTFIPLAYTAALFSMDERYMPGSAHFWIYFLVSIPLTVVVMLAYISLDKLYDEGVQIRLGALIMRMQHKSLSRSEEKKFFDVA